VSFTKKGIAKTTKGVIIKSGGGDTMKIYTSELERVIEDNIKPNLKMIYNLKIKGMKDKHIANALGISVGKFLEAKEAYGELKEVYEDAFLLLCSRLRDVAISRALGTDGREDKDGKMVPADANLALKLLERLDPLFSEKKEEKVSVTIEYIIHELSEKRKAERIEQERIITKNEARGVSLNES